MTLDAEMLLLRQLISLNDNAAKVDYSLRTNHSGSFRCRIAVVETTRERLMIFLGQII